MIVFVFGMTPSAASVPLECHTSEWVVDEHEASVTEPWLVPGLREDCDIDPKAFQLELEASSNWFLQHKWSRMQQTEDLCVDSLATSVDWTRLAECPQQCPGDPVTLDASSPPAEASSVCELRFDLHDVDHQCFGELVCTATCDRDFAALLACGQG